jgi:hypothetical protein
MRKRNLSSRRLRGFKSRPATRTYQVKGWSPGTAAAPSITRSQRIPGS